MMDLSKITTKGKAIYLAYDHGIEHGPVDLKGQSIDPKYILSLAVQGGYNAIILQKGVAEKYYPDYQEKIPLIVKLNGKTRLVGGEPLSTQLCSVAEAVELGAAAVGYTVYLGSQHEAKMLKEFSQIEQEAEEHNLVVIGWMYPRGKAVKDDDSPEMTAYAARVGLELGADIVKIRYCGSQECFAKAVKAAGRTKVVLSGGPKMADDEFLEVVENIMAAGAIGLAVGRNVWQRENPLEITQKLKEIIFK
ncbi:MAG: aldolase [Candidatus Portnoybacteria bacterium]|nr:aldolase [Candidatus Portnoybacteria bacterium]